jgi:hypothetical protein
LHDSNAIVQELSLPFNTVQNQSLVDNRVGVRVLEKFMQINNLAFARDYVICIINQSSSIGKCLFCIEFMLAEAMSITGRPGSKLRFLTVFRAVKNKAGQGQSLHDLGLLNFRDTA